MSGSNRTGISTVGGSFNSISNFESHLNFGAVGTFVRETASVSSLFEIYDNVQNGGSSLKAQEEGGNDAKPTVALIKGLAGTGKSTAAKIFMDHLEEKSKQSDGPVRPFFVQGKFNDLSVDPFSAIIEAFNGFGSQLSTSEEVTDELERVRKEVQAAMGNDEAEFLATVIPGLKDVTGISTCFPAGNNEHAPNRLKYIFQSFVNAISTETRPVVLLLDDLQWCDKASADLLEALLTDDDLRYLMFIGCYRSDEMTEDTPFYHALEAIENSQQVCNTELTNLTESDTKRFVAGVLNVDEDIIIPLSDVVYQRTHGNLLFVKQVLDEMHRKQILVFLRETQQWSWNLDNFENELSCNVTEAINQRLLRMSTKMQNVMMIMAYTRNGIDFATLHKLLELDGLEMTTQSLTKLLDKAVLDGHLMNSVGSTKYYFAHDRIRHAAHALVPEGSLRSKFRHTLGERLYRMGKEEGGDNWMLYVAADHLNGTTKDLGMDMLFPVKMNLEAGERAMSCAAFDTAANYLEFALDELLHLADPWESHYDLMLKVYHNVVEVKLCQGHLQIGQAIGDKVLQKAKRVEDKLPVLLAISRALGREDRHKESAEKSIATLQMLKQYPRGVVSLHAGLTKDFLFIRRYLKKHSDEDILNLPTLTDKKKHYVMKLLTASAYQSYYCGNLVGYMVGTLRMLRLSIKYGLCDHSSFAFTGYCLFCINLNDMEGAARFAGLAREILARFNAKHLESLQIFAVAYFMTAWQSNEEAIQLYNRAYKSGLTTGDVESGLMSRTAGIYHEFFAGHNLGDVDEKFASQIRKLQVYKVDSLLGITIQQRFVTQYLMGTATADLKKFEVPKKSDSSSTYRLIYTLLGRLQLGVFFADYDFALEMAKKLATPAQFENSYAVKALGTYFTSMTYAILARKRNKKSYATKARKLCNQLISLSNTKGENSRHRCMLLEAQLVSLSGKKASIVQSSFDEAINVAIQKGYKQDAGLGSVLAAEHFLGLDENVLTNPVLKKARDSLVGNYATEARQMYEQWGAHALVESIQSKYGKYIDIASKDMIEGNEKKLSQGLPSLNRDFSISRTTEEKDDISILSNHSDGWKLLQKAISA